MIKDRFYSLLNIVGLSIGITISLLITLYIIDEMSYDKFHQHAGSIYRVITKGKLGDANVMNVAVTGAPLAESMKSYIPEVKATVRLQPASLVINHNDEAIKETNAMYADSTFFEVFDFNLIRGNENSVLTEPYSMVMTRETAIRYFGLEQVENGDLLGKLIKSGKDTYQLTGIIEDVPDNSHFDFDFLLSMSTNPDANNPIWINMNYYTYVMLEEGTDIASLKDKLRDLVRQYVIPQVVAYLNFPEMEYTDDVLDQNFMYQLQPITDIHLHSNLHAELEANSDIQYIYIFSVIAVFVILIACINFMNLSTARSTKRAKEVGIRKTLGSSRSPLIGQFLMESMIFIVIAMLLALGLTEAFRIPFNTLTGKSLSFNIFNQPWIIGLIGLLILVVTFTAGIYPAFMLTRIKPLDVMKGIMRTGSRGSTFRSVLVVFQFMISIGLIVCTILVYKQMNFIQNKNLGFEKDNVIVLENASNLGESALVIKREIENLGKVTSTSYTTHIPSDLYWSSAHKAEGDLASDHIVFFSLVDYDFKKTMGFNMEHGRFFSRDYPSDSTAVVINEAAAYVFGWTENNGSEAIGKRIEVINTTGGSRGKYEVIGVMNDFNYETLRKEIRPMAMYLQPTGPKLTVKVDGSNIKETLQNIEEIWKSEAPWAPFEYSFLDDSFEQMFEREKRLGKVFSIFTILAIIVACMGLFGLAAYTSEQRTKEIGIRKVMGASTSTVLRMLTREFTKLVLIAYLIALPLAWYLMNQWLEAFAYKTRMGVWPFLIAGLIAVMISWLTVTYQSLKAARTNPVESLKDE